MSSLYLIYSTKHFPQQHYEASEELLKPLSNLKVVRKCKHTFLAIRVLVATENSKSLRAILDRQNRTKRPFGSRKNHYSKQLETSAGSWN